LPLSNTEVIGDLELRFNPKLVEEYDLEGTYKFPQDKYYIMRGAEMAILGDFKLGPEVRFVIVTEKEASANKIWKYFKEKMK
jgi:hypothetical protein